MRCSRYDVAEDKYMDVVCGSAAANSDLRRHNPLSTRKYGICREAVSSAWGIRASRRWESRRRESIISLDVTVQSCMCVLGGMQWKFLGKAYII